MASQVAVSLEAVIAVVEDTGRDRRQCRGFIPVFQYWLEPEPDPFGREPAKSLFIGKLMAALSKRYQKSMDIQYFLPYRFA